jgi:putative ATP-binding cassette transporter
MERLDEERSWDQILSGGEKQRLAFARVLLHRPNIIVLDEATAALDAPSQNRLTELLFQELKDATIVSVGHRLELAAFHQRKIVLKHDCWGAKLVSDVYRFPKHGRPRDLDLPVIDSLPAFHAGSFRVAVVGAELNP